MYWQRNHHKLKEDWGAFRKFVESLPYANELILGKTDGSLTLWPQRHDTDGFYICRMTRR